MPEPLIHFVASYIIARYFVKRRTLCLAIALVGVAPDLDALFGVHRSGTHSLALLAIAMAILVALSTRIDVLRKNISLIYLCSALYALHIAMDIFTGLTPIAWPFTDLGIYIRAHISVSMTSSVAVKPGIEIVVEPIHMHSVYGYSYVVASEIGVSLLIALTVLEILTSVRRS